MKYFVWLDKGVIIMTWLAFQTVATVTHFCSFETSDVCAYIQDTNDDFNWTRRQEGTPTSGTGPPYDHTLGVNLTGHYMYIEASSRGTWDLARLLTPAFSPTAGFCLRFFYHMYGEDTGRLSVRLWTNGEGASEALWTLKGQQGQEWTEAEVDGRSFGEFQLAFEAKRGEGFKSDIAIDDVSLKVDTTCRGILVTLPPTLPPVTSFNDDSSSPQSTHTQENNQQVGQTVTKQPDILPLKPIDSGLVVIVLSVGLTFWGVVFIVIAVVIYSSGQSGRRKSNVTSDPAYNPVDQKDVISASTSCRSIDVRTEYV